MLEKKGAISPQVSTMLAQALEAKTSPENGPTLNAEVAAVISDCLLYTSVKSVTDISREEFETYCFKPAYEKRKIVRMQLSIADRCV